LHVAALQLRVLRDDAAAAAAAARGCTAALQAALERLSAVIAKAGVRGALEV